MVSSEAPRGRLILLIYIPSGTRQGGRLNATTVLKERRSSLHGGHTGLGCLFQPPASVQRPSPKQDLLLLTWVALSSAPSITGHPHAQIFLCGPCLLSLSCPQHSLRLQIQCGSFSQPLKSNLLSIPIASAFIQALIIFTRVIAVAS